jgi:hypothetical protein
MSEHDNAVHEWRGKPEHLEVFIGDGLYVNFDGWHYTLRTRRVGLEGPADHLIYLETGKDGTLELFLEYVKATNTTGV